MQVECSPDKRCFDPLRRSVPVGADQCGSELGMQELFEPPRVPLHLILVFCKTSLQHQQINRRMDRRRYIIGSPSLLLLDPIPSQEDHTTPHHTTPHHTTPREDYSVLSSARRLICFCLNLLPGSEVSKSFQFYSRQETSLLVYWTRSLHLHCLN